MTLTKGRYNYDLFDAPFVAGTSFTTFSDAYAFAKALGRHVIVIPEGHSLSISPATVNDFVTIDTPLEVFGGGAITFNSPGNLNMNMIQVESPNVRFHGVSLLPTMSVGTTKFRLFGLGNADNFSVSRCYIDGVASKISGEAYAHVIVLENDASVSDVGFTENDVTNMNRTMFSNNDFDGEAFGWRFNNNSFYGNTGVDISLNADPDTGAGAGNPIRWRNCTVANNTFRNPAVDDPTATVVPAVAFEKTLNCVVTGNTFENYNQSNSKQECIHFENMNSGFTCTGNVFDNCARPIVVWGRSNNGTIVANSIKGTATMVDVEDPTTIRDKDGNFPTDISTACIGIYFVLDFQSGSNIWPERLTIESNSIEYCDIGIALNRKSPSNLIANNRFARCYSGLMIFNPESCSGTIRDNTLNFCRYAIMSTSNMDVGITGLYGMIGKQTIQDCTDFVGAGNTTGARFSMTGFSTGIQELVTIANSATHNFTIAKQVLHMYGNIIYSVFDSNGVAIITRRAVIDIDNGVLTSETNNQTVNIGTFTAAHSITGNHLQLQVTNGSGSDRDFIFIYEFDGMIMFNSVAT